MDYYERLNTELQFNIDCLGFFTRTQITAHERLVMLIRWNEAPAAARNWTRDQQKNGILTQE